MSSVGGECKILLVEFFLRSEFNDTR